MVMKKLNLVIGLALFAWSCGSESDNLKSRLLLLEQVEDAAPVK
jgi:hypothetical protein